MSDAIALSRGTQYLPVGKWAKPNHSNSVTSLLPALAYADPQMVGVGATERCQSQR